MKPSTTAANVAAGEADAPRLCTTGYIRARDSSIQAVHREMLLCARDGQPVGQVAALVLDPRTHEPTHLLLSCWPTQIEYRLVAVALIDQVQDENIRLEITRPEVGELPQWQSADSC